MEGAVGIHQYSVKGVGRGGSRGFDLTPFSEGPLSELDAR